MPRKYYPQIKFILDSKRDKKSLLERNLGTRKVLPIGMEFVFKKEFIRHKNQILSAFLDEYYQDMDGYLKDSVNHIQIKWHKVEKIFFKKVDVLFYNWPWPKGNYRAYLSVGRSFPRYIKQKIFAFPMRSYNPTFANRDLRIIAHEMLHFMEYDYLQKKFGLKPSEIYSPDNTFWQFTENLNVLIENSPSWRQFNQVGFKFKPYAECADLYKKMKKIWDKNKDIDNLVEKIFKL